MDLDFNIYTILMIVGIIQGLIFTAVVLLNKKYHAKSTLFLVALIFSYTFGNFMYVLPEIGAMPFLKMYGYLYLPLASIDVVLMYFYVVYLAYDLNYTTSANFFVTWIEMKKLFIMK